MAWVDGYWYVIGQGDKLTELEVLLTLGVPELDGLGVPELDGRGAPELDGVEGPDFAGLGTCSTGEADSAETVMLLLPLLL